MRPDEEEVWGGEGEGTGQPRAQRGVSPREIVIRVSGTGFLYNMVRIIAGTLMEVGRGAIEPEQVPAILEACDRSKAGPTAPPEGLTLVRVSDSSCWLEMAKDGWIRAARMDAATRKKSGKISKKLTHLRSYLIMFGCDGDELRLFDAQTPRFWIICRLRIAHK